MKAAYEFGGPAFTGMTYWGGFNSARYAWAETPTSFNADLFPSTRPRLALPSACSLRAVSSHARSPDQPQRLQRKRFLPVNTRNKRSTGFD